MLESGTLKDGIRLSENNITFNFDIEDKPKKDSGITLGLDIGISKVFTTSDKQLGKKDIHGWDLTKIQHKLSRRYKGSTGFERVQQHRKNYINWSLNQLNLNDVKILKLENIKDLRRNNKVSRFMSHWTYTDISYKLESLCEEHGVQTLYINSTYTSQRCSKCGWVRKSNRKGKMFRCTSCGYTHDADLNASINISIDLMPIGKKERQLNLNRAGFYWLVGEENIVPHVLKTKSDDFS
jgi:IS605 OrfB family transposase